LSHSLLTFELEGIHHALVIRKTPPSEFRRIFENSAKSNEVFQ
jgi:hypothetical protein